MEYASLLLLHVFFGILWAGGAIAAGFFIIPAVLEAGPAGGAVMAGVMKRKFAVLMTASGFVVVLSGLRLYSLLVSGAWIVTPQGIVLSLGGLAGLGGLAIGFFVQKPTAERLSALAGQLAAAGTPPTPEQTAEMEGLRQRLGKVARVTAWHLLVAAVLMAGHRLAAML
jgi:uncharacterized membrane protein